MIRRLLSGWCVDRSEFEGASCGCAAQTRGRQGHPWGLNCETASLGGTHGRRPWALGVEVRLRDGGGAQPGGMGGGVV